MWSNRATDLYNQGTNAQMQGYHAPREKILSYAVPSLFQFGARVVCHDPLGARGAKRGLHRQGDSRR